MQPFIGCDAHKQYSVFVSVNHQGQASRPVRVKHDRDLHRRYLDQLPPRSEIALEATGHSYGLVYEMERAGQIPYLANPLETKKRMGGPHKTDSLDAKGLAILLRNGTLPESWIPPGELRDQRKALEEKNRELAGLLELVYGELALAREKHVSIGSSF